MAPSTRRRHSPESLARLIADHARDLGRIPTSNEFSRATGVSSSTIVRHGGWESLAASAARLAPGTAGTPEEAARVAREHRMRAEAKDRQNELRTLVKHLEKKVATLQEKNDFLLGVGELVEEWTPYPIVASRRSGPLPEGLFVALASDWHLGERVRPEEVGFRNEYNPEIAQERARYYFRSVRTMLNAARAAWSIDKLLLAVIGDMITGYIHEEYEAENFLSPTEETMLAYRVLIEGIDYLLAEGDLKEILVATANGNHGRTERKKRVSGNFRNSYEFMLYQLLAIHYKDEKRVKFQLGHGTYNVVDAYGFLIRLSHGDQIRSQGGVGGLAPPLYRLIGKLPRVGIDCQGHHHTLDFLRRFARNGSLIGWNAFAEWLGCEPEAPMQAAFVVDSKHKVACNFQPLFVTKDFNGAQVIR